MALSDATGGAPSPAAPTRDWPAFSAQTRLLMVAPHPDDETIATGLLIQQVQEAGGEVRILLLTVGDNNPWPQRWLERRLWVGAADRRRWGQRRHAEMLLALRCLGVPAQALHPLGWPDMGLTGAVLQPDGSAVSVLAAAIDQFRPDLVVLPALADRHPDHGSAHVLVRLALAGQADPPELLAYLVHGDAGQERLLEIPGTADQAANKRSALAAHRSQMALSGGRMRRLAARPERFIKVLPEPSGVGAVLPWQPPFWLKPWLRLSVVGVGGARSWRWRDAPVQRDRHGRYQLLPAAGLEGRPLFARLALTLPVLWIFDHWGWCELPGGFRDLVADLAQAD